MSGAAGLHLNVLNILVRLVGSAGKNANLTEECWTRVAEAAHITTALYVTGDRFMENAVMSLHIVAAMTKPVS